MASEAAAAATSATTTTTGTTTDARANINIARGSLEEALTQFREKSHERCHPCWSNNSTTLDIHRVCFNNRVMVEHLTEFLCNGKNRDGHAVYDFDLDPCTCFVTDESSRLAFCNFFKSNKSPPTLQSVSLSSSEKSSDRYDAAAVYEILLSAFHNNSTVKSLVLLPSCALRGTMVGDLLLQNKTLTLFHLSKCHMNRDFMHAMREGLLSTRCRLQRLGLQFNHIGSKVLQQLQLMYESNGHHQNNVLSELDLSHNDIEGPTSGNHLRRLLLTLPHLKKLNLSFNDLGPDGARALFAVDATCTASVMSRLQSLGLGHCKIGNVGLTQMVASMPESSSSASLVYLNLASNDIHGQSGGESLVRLLHCCEKLETLHLPSNHLLGPEGAGALALALAHHSCLQNLDLNYCYIGDSGALEILKNLITVTRPTCLKSLRLGANKLSPTILVSLADYLKGPGQSLEELRLQGNGHLFETGNEDQRGSLFFEALAKHKILHTLDLSCCGMDELSKGSLLSSLLQNTSLLHVRYYPYELESIMAEYMRRNKVLSKMKTTMDKKPVDVALPLAMWPVALDVASPARRDNQLVIGPTLAFCLIQKMMVSNVYSHTAAIYRFEKVRACTRVQRWWRRRLQALWIDILNTVQLTIKYDHDY